jgi:uncharacterized coiled-coil DUF342 family protein
MNPKKRMKPRKINLRMVRRGVRATMSPETDEQIKRQIDEVRQKLDSEWQNLDNIFKKIRGKNEEINNLKARRDEFNQQVKTLISEGKAKQKERDEHRETIKPMLEVIKNLRLNIKEYAKQISELKNIRDGKHREAKGSLDGLKDNIAASVTTLLNLDLALKDEITLFNMIFSTQDRYSAKVQADDTHSQIQEVYSALKESENQIMGIEEQIAKIKEESQGKHLESMEKFKQKDAAREQSNELHNKVVSGYKDIKQLKEVALDSKKTVAELKGKLNALYRKLKTGARKRQEMAKKDKLEGAKKKLKGEKKMGLDELRLLIESGELKD